MWLIIFLDITSIIGAGSLLLLQIFRHAKSRGLGNIISINCIQSWAWWLISCLAIVNKTSSLFFHNFVNLLVLMKRFAWETTFYWHDWHIILNWRKLLLRIHESILSLRKAWFFTNKFLILMILDWPRNILNMLKLTLSYLLRLIYISSSCWSLSRWHGSINRMIYCFP